MHDLKKPELKVVRAGTLNGARASPAVTWTPGFKARTPESYRADRRHAKTMNATARENFMSSLGITSFAHAFTRIPFFEAMQGVPRDLMHMELEGNLKVHLYGFSSWLSRDTNGLHSSN